MRRSIITPPKLKMPSQKAIKLETKLCATNVAREKWLKRLRHAWTEFDKHDKQSRRLRKEITKLED
jgi:hypothetical protein